METIQEASADVLDWCRLNSLILTVHVLCGVRHVFGAVKAG